MNYICFSQWHELKKLLANMNDLYQSTVAQMAKWVAAESRVCGSNNAKVPMKHASIYQSLANWNGSQEKKTEKNHSSICHSITIMCT